MPSRIQVRRDSAARWTATNPILLPGEIGFEIDTGKVKIGDGLAAWDALSYTVEPAAVAADHAKLADIEPGAEVNLVASVHGRTGAVQAAPGDYTAEQITDTAAKVVMTAAERAKLGAIEAGAQVNPISLDDLRDGEERLAMTETERLKLAGIAAGADVSAVRSVNGRSGAVVAAAGDYNAEQISDTAAKVIMTAAERAKLAGLATSAVLSVHGRTGAIVAAAGDYNAQQITDTATKVIMTMGERHKLTAIQTGAQVNTVTSVHGRTGAIVGQSGDYTAEQIGDGATKVVMTTAERAKLAGVEAGAEANPTNLDALPDGATRLALSATERSKLAGIQAGAQVNAVASVHGRVGAVVAATGDYTAEQIGDGTTKVVMTATERAKLTGIEAGAQVNPATLDGVPDSSTRLAFSTSERSKLAGMQAGAQVNAVVSVHGRTGAVVAATGDYTAEQIRDGSTKVVMTSAERAKLSGIQSGAQANTVASVHGRTGAVTAQSGDYTAEQIGDGTTKVVMTTVERAKLSGIEAGAQINPATLEELRDGTTRLALSADERSKLAGIQAGAQVNALASVHGRTGAVVAQPGDYTAEQIGDGTTKVVMTTAERTKLAGVAAGAQANPPLATQAELDEGTVTTARTYSPAQLAQLRTGARATPLNTNGSVRFGPRSRTWAVGTNIICEGNSYTATSYNNAYDDSAVSALFAEFVRRGVSWASIRVIWRTMVANSASLANRTAVTLSDTAIGDIKRLIKWANVYNIQLMLDFHTLFDSSKDWMLPQYVYPWSSFTSGTAQTIAAGQGNYYGTTLPIPAQTFRPELYTGTSGMTYQSLWHPTITLNRDLFGDFQAAVCAALAGAEGLETIKMISMLNEPFGDWTSVENGNRHLAVYLYLRDRLNSVAWCRDCKKTVRWLASENPWQVDPKKKVAATAKTALDVWSINMYLNNYALPTDNAQFGAGPWDRRASFHPPYKVMAQEALDTGKEWYVSEHGPHVDNLQYQDDYLAYYYNDFLWSLVKQPTAIFFWSADNSGRNANIWHTESTPYNFQALKSKGKLSDQFVKYVCGLDPTTGAPFPGPTVVPWPSMRVTDAMIAGTTTLPGGDPAPDIRRLDRRFANRGTVTFELAAARSLTIYPGSFLAGDVVQLRNEGAAISFSVQSGMTLIGTASLPAGTPAAPTIREIFFRDPAYAIIS